MVTIFSSLFIIIFTLVFSFLFSLTLKEKRKNGSLRRGDRILTRYGMVEGRILEVADEHIRIRLIDNREYWTLAESVNRLPERWLR